MFSAILPRVVRFYNEYYRFFRMTEHCHPEDEIMYVEQGACKISCFDDESGTWHDVALTAGHYIFIRGGTLHNLSVERESPCRILNLEYTTPAPADRDFAPWTVSLDDGSLLRILGIVHDKLREKEKGEYPDRDSTEEDIGLSVFLLERKIIQQQMNPPAAFDQASRYVSAAKEYIREHYAEELFVADIACHVGIAPAYLQRLFRRETGSTVMEAVNRLRLTRSKYLLTHSGLSLADVAENAGFGSRQRLSQVFRTMEHCSPGEYRKTAGDPPKE